MNKTNQENKSINILLADDDRDDRFFFDIALKDIPLNTNLKTVNDGQQLMDHFNKYPDDLPDLLFLDLNMPRLNGFECLVQIKSRQQLKEIPVIIYSTSQPGSSADTLYNNGAHYYLYKRDLNELKEILLLVLTKFRNNTFTRPDRKEFILDSIKV